MQQRGPNQIVLLYLHTLITVVTTASATAHPSEMIVQSWHYGEPAKHPTR